MTTLDSNIEQKWTQTVSYWLIYTRNWAEAHDEI